jgi:type II secretion system protein N
VGLVFNVDIFEGDIDGKLKSSKKSTSIKLDLDDLDISRVEPLTGLLGIPFKGELSGDADLSYTSKDMEGPKGAVGLKVRGLQLGDKDSQIDLSRAGGGILKGAIKFDPVEMGNLVIKLKGEQGVVKVTTFGSSSNHIDLKGGGDITVRKPTPQSQLNLYVMFRFKDAYVQKSAMTKTVFSTIERLTKFRQAKRKDGFFGFSIKGALAGGIQTVPARTGPDGM